MICKFTNTYYGIAKQQWQKETQPQLPQSKFQAQSSAASLQARQHQEAYVDLEGISPNLHSGMIVLCLGSLQQYTILSFAFNMYSDLSAT